MISATQMAFVEEAGGTYEFLQRMHAFHRYISGGGRPVLLGREVSMLSDALHLLRCSVNTLDVHIERSGLPEDFETTRGSLLFPVLELVEEHLDSCEPAPRFLIDFSVSGDACVHVRVALENGSSGEGKIITERILTPYVESTDSR
jgi:hypothetical protein